MRRSFFQGSLKLGLVAAVAALMVTVTACNENLTKVDVKLEAPPGVPAPLHRGRAHIVVNLETIEKDVEIAPGVQYKVWTFNGSVPGPMIRVREGDEVEVHLKNNAASEMTHNIDLHSVNGPGGGAGATTVKPGEEKQFTFKALAPGLYVYHCATGIVADHIGNGMYGAILVEPDTMRAISISNDIVPIAEFKTNISSGSKRFRPPATHLLLPKIASQRVYCCQLRITMSW